MRENFFSKNNKNHDSSYDDEIDSVVENSNIVSYENQENNQISNIKLVSMNDKGS
jgi:hypothetical protein